MNQIFIEMLLDPSFASIYSSPEEFIITENWKLYVRISDYNIDCSITEIVNFFIFHLSGPSPRSKYLAYTPCGEDGIRHFSMAYWWNSFSNFPSNAPISTRVQVCNLGLMEHTCLQGICLWIEGLAWHSIREQVCCWFQESRHHQVSFFKDFNFILLFLLYMFLLPQEFFFHYSLYQVFHQWPSWIPSPFVHASSSWLFVWTIQPFEWKESQKVAPLRSGRCVL